MSNPSDYCMCLHGAYNSNYLAIKDSHMLIYINIDMGNNLWDYSCVSDVIMQK